MWQMNHVKVHVWKMCEDNVKRLKSDLLKGLMISDWCWTSYGLILEAGCGCCYFPNPFFIEIRQWRWWNVLLVQENGTSGPVITSLKASMTPGGPSSIQDWMAFSSEKRNAGEETSARTTQQRSHSNELDLNGLKTCCRTLEIL